MSGFHRGRWIFAERSASTAAARATRPIAFPRAGPSSGARTPPMAPGCWRSRVRTKPWSAARTATVPNGCSTVCPVSSVPTTSRKHSPQTRHRRPAGPRRHRCAPRRHRSCVGSPCARCPGTEGARCGGVARLAVPDQQRRHRPGWRQDAATATAMARHPVLGVAQVRSRTRAHAHHSRRRDH